MHPTLYRAIRTLSDEGLAGAASLLGMLVADSDHDAGHCRAWGRVTDVESLLHEETTIRAERKERKKEKRQRKIRDSLSALTKPQWEVEFEQGGMHMRGHGEFEVVRPIVPPGTSGEVKLPPGSAVHRYVRTGGQIEAAPPATTYIPTADSGVDETAAALPEPSPPEPETQQTPGAGVDDRSDFAEGLREMASAIADMEPTESSEPPKAEPKCSKCGEPSTRKTCRACVAKAGNEKRWGSPESRTPKAFTRSGACDDCGKAFTWESGIPWGKPRSRCDDCGGPKKGAYRTGKSQATPAPTPPPPVLPTAEDVAAELVEPVDDLEVVAPPEPAIELEVTPDDDGPESPEDLAEPDDVPLPTRGRPPAPTWRCQCGAIAHTPTQPISCSHCGKPWRPAKPSVDPNWLDHMKAEKAKPEPPLTPLPATEGKPRRGICNAGRSCGEVDLVTGGDGRPYCPICASRWVTPIVAVTKDAQGRRVTRLASPGWDAQKTDGGGNADYQSAGLAGGSLGGTKL